MLRSLITLTIDQQSTATVVGNWTYIDGGEYSFLKGSVPAFYYCGLSHSIDSKETLVVLTNTVAKSLLSIDLSNNWTNSTVNIRYSPKPKGVPSLNDPSLWYYEKNNSLYTGFTGWNSTWETPNGKTQVLPDLSLWSYRLDDSGGGEWDEVIGPDARTWRSLSRPSTPLQAQSPDKAMILGGTNELQGWSIIKDMVQLDMQDLTFTNTSAPAFNATNGIYRGAMHYVPSFGSKGISLTMGGGNGLNHPSGPDTLIDLGVVSVIDVAKQEWYNQTTTGTAPSPRIEFCTAGKNSTNGTYEMYDQFLYAGLKTRKLKHVRTDSYTLVGIRCLALPPSRSIPFTPHSPSFPSDSGAISSSVSPAW